MTEEPFVLQNEQSTEPRPWMGGMENKRMPAAAAWDSFSMGAKGESQGGLERAPGNGDSAETGQEISVAVISPWFML